MKEKKRDPGISHCWGQKKKKQEESTFLKDRREKQSLLGGLGKGHTKKAKSFLAD